MFFSLSSEGYLSPIKPVENKQFPNSSSENLKNIFSWTPCSDGNTWQYFILILLVNLSFYYPFPVTQSEQIKNEPLRKRPQPLLQWNVKECHTVLFQFSGFEEDHSMHQVLLREALYKFVPYEIHYLPSYGISLLSLYLPRANLCHQILCQWSIPPRSGISINRDSMLGPPSSLALSWRSRHRLLTQWDYSIANHFRHHK